jgi:hypothetical protein
MKKVLAVVLATARKHYSISVLLVLVKPFIIIDIGQI